LPRNQTQPTRFSGAFLTHFTCDPFIKLTKMAYVYGKTAGKFEEEACHASEVVHLCFRPVVLKVGEFAQ